VIRSLRARHRVLVAGVGLVAGAIGVAGLSARRPVPAVALPAALERSETVERAVPAQATLRFDSASVRGELAALEGGDAVVTIEVDDPGATGPLAAYWTPVGHGDELSADAIFLGSIAAHRSTRLRLPDRHTRDSGRVVVFDLGDARVIAAADVVPEGGPP